MRESPIRTPKEQTLVSRTKSETLRLKGPYLDSTLESLRTPKEQKGFKPY
jgi:hypothetical protein